MNRSPESLISVADKQLTETKWDDKAFTCRKEGEAKLRAATQVNAVSASSTPPTSRPTQLDLFPGRACPLKAKPATNEMDAGGPKAQASKRKGLVRRDGVQGGGTQPKSIKITGETLFGPESKETTGREAHKGGTRKCSNEAKQGVGGGQSTVETRENREEGRAATSTTRTKRGKTAGLRPRGSAIARPKSAKRMDKVRKLQRTLYRVAKQEPNRRFVHLYDKVSRADILQEAWKRVKANQGAAGVDRVSIEEVEFRGEREFLGKLQERLQTGSYRAQTVRRVYIPKPGQPGARRPLGIPAIEDRVVQMAVKLVIEPLFKADFLPCSYGFRPRRTTRMALDGIVGSLNEGYTEVVDVDLKSYFDTINHEQLMKQVERRVADVRVLRLIRAWLKAGVMEEGKVTHPVRGSPQGGVISPLLSNIYLHEIDRQWDGNQEVRLYRYADDMVLLARTSRKAEEAWEKLKEQLAKLKLEVNQEKSRLVTAEQGFAFLGFELRRKRSLTYLWPRARACKHVGERIREVVRTVPSNGMLKDVIRKLNPVLNGWCTYFRVGNSNRTFHKIDWEARSQIQLWLRRKHQCSWAKAKGRWTYRFLHERCRLYRMAGKVSHLPNLERKRPKEGGRRAGCGKTARPVR